MREAKRLLVVDDEPELCASVAALFERRGWSVARVHDGWNALLRARAEQWDALVLDVSLPGLDGWEVLERLKDDPRTCAIPVVMFTAIYASVHTAQAAIHAGAVEFMSKPFLADVLVHNVERLIGRVP